MGKRSRKKIRVCYVFPLKKSFHDLTISFDTNKIEIIRKMSNIELI